MSTSKITKSKKLEDVVGPNVKLPCVKNKAVLVKDMIIIHKGLRLMI